MTIFFFSNQW